MIMIALPTLLQIVQEPFFVWVTLSEHKWVILGERRGSDRNWEEVHQRPSYSPEFSRELSESLQVSAGP
jgi:hypothetical protein